MFRHTAIIILIFFLLVGCSHKQEHASVTAPENETVNSLMSAYLSARETYNETAKEQDASFSYADYYKIRDSFTS